MAVPPRILKVTFEFCINLYIRKPKDLLKSLVSIILFVNYSPVVGIYAEPNENNYRHFFVKIAGPS